MWAFLVLFHGFARWPGTAVLPATAQRQLSHPTRQLQISLNTASLIFHLLKTFSSLLKAQLCKHEIINPLSKQEPPRATATRHSCGLSIQDSTKASNLSSTPTVLPQAAQVKQRQEFLCFLHHCSYQTPVPPFRRPITRAEHSRSQ